MDIGKIAAIISIALLIIGIILTAFYYRSSRAKMLKDQQEQCQKDIAALDNDVSKSLNDIERLSRLSPPLRQKLDEQAAELARIKNELERSAAEFNEKCKAASSGNNDGECNNKLSTLQESLDKKYLDKVNEMSAAAAELNKIIESLKKERDDCSIRASREGTISSEKAAALAEQTQQCDARIEALNVEKLALIKSAEDLAAAQKKRAEEAESALSPLRTDLSLKEAAIQQLNQRIQELTADYNNASSLKTAAESEVAKIYADFKLRGGDYSSQYPNAKYLNLFKVTKGSEISGSNIGNWDNPANFDHPTPETCAKRCFDDYNCRAFTYDQNWPSPYDSTKKGYCALKSTNIISGTMNGRDVYRI